jgi:hypothetical protein
MRRKVDPPLAMVDPRTHGVAGASQSPQTKVSMALLVAKIPHLAMQILRHNP